MGRTLGGRYRVESVIGTGGMGAVCRAYDPKLERSVAVKVMTAVCPDPGELERLRARFYREARAAARLRHPHVVTVHDFGTDPELGIDFLVMELLDGEDLSGRLRRAAGPLSVPEALEILREAAMGLHAGHRAGLVHRDVKPGNVYLEAEPGGWAVKLLDFGIALMSGEAEGDTDTRLTVAGSPHTPRYASPEQRRGDTALTPASDVYSLALTGMEMLAGAYPDGLNTDTTDRAAARAVKRLVDARPEVPLRLASALRRALRLRPEERFRDAGAFLEALNGTTAAPAGMAAAGRTAYTFEREAAETLHAPVMDAPEGTVLAPPLQGPPPAPAGASAPPARRSVHPGRRSVALWMGSVAVAVALMVGGIQLGRSGGGAPEGDPPAGEVSDAPGGVALAREEARRVRGRHGADEGDTLRVVVLASFGADELPQARAARDRLRERGHRVGLANSLVYPELLDGYVVLVAGPYSRGRAPRELERLRREVARDAFPKVVTLRVP